MLKMIELQPPYSGRALLNTNVGFLIMGSRFYYEYSRYLFDVSCDKKHTLAEWHAEIERLSR